MSTLEHNLENALIEKLCDLKYKVKDINDLYSPGTT
ncbi:hypothetical protein F890_02647 [Acinetobacter sp. CIP 64.7]|nr:hypothetical protein F890_02647 [Acinetobacter sp. CIP 64.7]SPJ20890.1 hypothetical protein PFCIP103579_2034 [Prolinoborus fasciculus]